MKKLVKLFLTILILSYAIYSLTSFANTNEIIDEKVTDETNTFDFKNEVSNVNEDNEVDTLNIDNLNMINEVKDSDIEEVSSKDSELLSYQDGLVKIGNDWRVVINGKIDYNYTGIATNQNGTWFVKNGTKK